MVFSENFFGSGTAPLNPNGPNSGPGPDPGRHIGSSLRFRGSQYLTRSNATASESTTYSCWFKLGKVGVDSIPLSLSGGGGVCQLIFNADGTITGDGTASQNCITSSLYRDPGAWYHLVYTRGTNETRLFINGEETPYSSFTTGAGTPITAGTFAIGSVNSVNSLFYEGYMSDIYFIDGQQLEPTVFGRYNEAGVWVPTAPNFGISQVRYSDYVTSNTGGYYPNTGPTDMFDGQLSTYTQTDDASGTSTLLFEPPNPIPYTSSVEIYFGGPTVSLNGEADQTPAINQWSTIATGSGEITSMLFTGAYGGTVYGIKVDGVFLTDPYLWSSQLVRLDGTTPTGFTNVAQAFDGDTTTAATGAANAHAKFAPSTPIPFNEKIEVWLNGPAGVPWSYFPNGNDQPGAPAASATGSWTTVYEGSGVIDANHMISGGAIGSGWSLNGIRVDGKVLVDGANPNFGPNGFHLDFADPNDIGADRSGNANQFTATGFELANQTSPNWDHMQDSPTQNYATLNPLVPGNTSFTFASANLSATYPNALNQERGFNGMQLSTQKAYWEIDIVDHGETMEFGIATQKAFVAIVNTSLDSYTVRTNGEIHANGTQVSTGNPTFNTNGSVAGFTWDGNSGVLQYTVDGATYTTISTDPGNYFVVARIGGNCEVATNFGQRPFIHTPPAGFEALQTQNLPEATITDGSEHFQAITGPGDGANATPSPGQIAGNWSQDLTVSGYSNNDSTLYAKTNAFNGNTGGTMFTSDPEGNWTFAPTTPIPVTSSIKVYQANSAGATTWNGQTLQPNTTFIEFTGAGEISQAFPIESTTAGTGGQSCFLGAIEVDGEILVDYGILPAAQQTFPDGLWWVKDRVNSNDHQLVDSVRGGNLALTCPTKSAQTSYSAPSGQSVAWCWKTDENGLNTNAGFQILTYTGVDATSQVIPHNLDPSKPLDLVIVKGYDAPDTSTYVNSANFLIWHKDMLPNNYAYLNTSGALTGVADSFWTSTGLNTTLGNLTVGNDPDTNNGPSVRGGAIEYVAYLWQEVPGFSAFGTYEGNSSAAGPFINTGFRPAMVLIKSINTTNNWILRDSTRGLYNPIQTYNYINTTATEATGREIDFLSNGFKLRYSGALDNTTGTNYIYAAFAENPFSYPVTAR